MKLYDWGDYAVTETILETAGRLTSRDRNASYGHPLDDYTCTAALFAAILRHAGKLKDGAVIEPELAQLMMIQVKASRLAQNLRHRDSLIDIAGYARTIEMTIDERDNRWAKAAEQSGDEVELPELVETSSAG